MVEIDWVVFGSLMFTFGAVSCALVMALFHRYGV